MLDLRLYRVTLLPFAIGLIVVAFSLHAAPDGAARARSRPPRFDAEQAYGVMIALARRPAATRRPARPPTTRSRSAIATAATACADANFQSVRVVRNARADDGRRAHDRDGDRDPRSAPGRASR